MADDAPVDLEALVPLLNDYLDAAGWPEARRLEARAEAGLIAARTWAAGPRAGACGRRRRRP
jgi:hypothetical protein